MNPTVSAPLPGQCPSGSTNIHEMTPGGCIPSLQRSGSANGAARRARRFGAVLTLLIALHVTPATAKNISFQSDPITQWPGYGTGPALDVEVVGNLALVAAGHGLQIVDFSDPSHPVRVSGVDLPHHAGQISLRGDLAFMEGENMASPVMSVIRVADPYQPTWLGRLMLQQANTAWLSVSSGPVSTMDISDPTHPIQLRRLFAGQYRVRIAVAGNLVFQAAGYDGVRILDFSVPDEPVEVGHIQTRAYAAHLALMGSLVFVAELGEPESTGFMEVFDVSDPTRPVEVASLPTLHALRVAVSGNRAVLACRVKSGDETYEGGLQVIDVSDPAFPMPLGYLDTHLMEDLDLAGHLAIGADHHGLTWYDIRNPAAPVEVGHLLTSGSVRDVEMAGDLAFLANSLLTQSLDVLDVSDPANPRSIGSAATRGLPLELARSGDLIGVAEGEAGIELIDVSDPTNPLPLGHLETPGSAVAIDLDGTRAFVAAKEAGLIMLDVSDPTQPRPLGAWSAAGEVRDVKVADAFAYLATDENLVILDVRRPSRPIRVATVSIPDSWTGTVRGVELAGHLACVVTDNKGLHLVDVTDPRHPVLAGSLEGSELLSRDVKVVGNLAFLATRHGLRAVDINDPARPVWVGGVETSRRILDVEVAGNVLYLAEENGGLTTHEFTANNPPNPILHIEPSIRLPGVTNVFLVIAHDDAKATVTLDASPTREADGDPLAFAWYAGPGSRLGQGPAITLTANLGRHSAVVLVSDGVDHDRASLTYVVLSREQAMEWLVQQVSLSPLQERTKRQLIHNLAGANDALHRGQTRLGHFRLKLFQLRVRSRLAPVDAPLAHSLIEVAQELMTPTSP